MEHTKKTYALCLLTVIAFGLNMLSNYYFMAQFMFLSIVLSSLIVIGCVLSRDKGRYIRWFLLAVNGLYVFFFGVIMLLAKTIT